MLIYQPKVNLCVFFKMKNIFPLLLFALLVCFLYNSCKKDPDNQLPETDYSTGVLICNEGLYPNGAGSISFYDPATKTVQNNLFENINNRPLGNTVQSVTTIADKTYIVVTSAGRVEVVNSQNFTYLTALDNLLLPRYLMAVNSQKAYLTVWGENGVNGAVLVVNLLTNQIAKTIPVAKGPEMMVMVGNRVFVPCEGGYDFTNYDNKIAIINTNTDELETLLTVPDYPNSIIADATGAVWALCGGKVVYNTDWTINETLSTKGGLVKINGATATVESAWEFADVGNAGSLTINAAKTELYYSFNGSIYRILASSAQFNPSLLLSHSYYGMAIDPNNNLLYGADPADYQSNGRIIRHQLTDGAVLDTLTAGIIPNGSFWFGL